MPDKKPRRGGRSGRAPAAGPTPGRHPVRFGTAELLADADRPGGWLLTVDDVPQSYVDLDDPAHLEFEYVQRMGEVLDALPPAGAALDAVHVGGGACTLPRYLAATRPGSRHLVIEADGPLAELVREQLALRSVPHLRVRVGDGRAEVATLREDSADLLVADAFVGSVMPGGLGAREFVAQVDRVLRPGGVYLLNIAADTALVTGRRVLATVAERFPELLVLADPGVLRAKRPGNLVVAACRQPLPAAELARRAAGAPFPVRLLTGGDLRKFIGTAKPIDDENPAGTESNPSDEADQGQDAEVTR
ncbi:MAG TPA: fused MFS/spermidine synthase [Pseudonocardiaceae bacterium]|jgi:SAM-dependent methyltransferase|nr:fused MFS/spermidine synthase [Pseudonocardiaceae bacterium]